jgi:serine-type anaerobic sulfatase-maturating enzyme
VNDERCEFFREQYFLIGLSLDGTREMNDAYRVDKSGAGTFDRVVGAARLMQKRNVEFNILTTVNATNGDHPLELYRFLRDWLSSNIRSLREWRYGHKSSSKNQSPLTKGLSCQN